MVDSPHERVRSRRDDGEGIETLSGIAVCPAIPQSRKGERLSGLELNPHRHLAVTVAPVEHS